MYIDDCLEGTQRLMRAATSSSRSTSAAIELVTINQLVDIVEEIAGVTLKRRYKLDAPKGVRGRNSDNTLIKRGSAGRPRSGSKRDASRPIEWIYDQMTSGKASVADTVPRAVAAQS